MNEQDVLIYFVGAALAGVAHNNNLTPELCADRAVEMGQRAMEKLSMHIAHRTNEAARAAHASAFNPNVAPAQPSVASTTRMNGA